MANIYEKCSRARLRFIGRKVRRIFDERPFRLCVNVICHGPPSGWTCVYELQFENGDDIKVERISDVEIESNSVVPMKRKRKN
jgi:hypothetical protein